MNNILNQLENSLIFYAPCSGETVDLAQGIPLTLAGPPTLEQGQIGLCSVFDSVSKYITFTLPEWYNYGVNDFTIMAWIKRVNTTGGASTGRIVDCDFNSTTRGPITFYANADETATNKLILGIFQGTSFAYQYENTASTNDLNWHHVVGLRRAGVLELYTDGVKRTSVTNAGTQSQRTSIVSRLVGIGRNQFSGTQSNLKIQQVKIYNKALTLEEIQAVYNNYLYGVQSANFSIVSDYKLNEGTGTTITDYSNVFPNNGTISSATWADGVNGKCLYFNGSSYYASFTATSKMTQLAMSDFSIRALIKAEAKTTDLGTIFGKYQNSGGGLSLRLLYDGSSQAKLYFSIMNTSSTEFTWQTAYGTVPLNQWIEVVATYNNTTKKGLLYINGKVIALTTDNTFSGTYLEPSIDWNIGRLSSVNAQYFKGWIGRVTIYNKLLTPLQISNKYFKTKRQICG